MTSSAVLGLDAGGSGTKWVLLEQRQVRAQGQVAPLTNAILETQGGQQALAELKAALPYQPQGIHIGLPGLSAGSERASAVAQLLAHTFDLSPALVSVEGDLDLAYRAHLQPGEGILIYAGTGSIAYHIDQAGQVARAGGRGYRIGDDGGGASIGRAALRWVTDRLDIGQLPDGPLAEEVALITGGLDWDTLRGFVYGTQGASALAKIAPAVSQAAARGDRVSQLMLEDAAASLLEIGRRVQQQVGPLPLVATGGALQSQELQRALRQLAPDITIQFRNHAEAGARYWQQQHQLNLL